jgi:hypothetical protein
MPRAGASVRRLISWINSLNSSSISPWGHRQVRDDDDDNDDDDDDDDLEDDEDDDGLSCGWGSGLSVFGRLCSRSAYEYQKQKLLLLMMMMMFDDDALFRPGSGVRP